MDSATDNEINSNVSIKIVIRDETKKEEAIGLLEKLGAELVMETNPEASENYDENAYNRKKIKDDISKTALKNYDEPTLIYDKKGLIFCAGGQTMMGDFEKLLPRLKKNNLSGEMLVKAAKIKGNEESPRLLDATAGMGEDSLILAAAGFEVTLYEKDLIIAKLLKDTMRRAEGNPLLRDIVKRMHLICGDSIEAMNAMHGDKRQFDVILLDPMFPKRQKSGLVKKKFQLLHNLERPCANENELLAAALVAAKRKIIIKRPLKAEYLAGRKPDYSLDGKAIRYDCIIIHG